MGFLPKLSCLQFYRNVNTTDVLKHSNSMADESTFTHNCSSTYIIKEEYWMGSQLKKLLCFNSYDLDLDLGLPSLAGGVIS